MNSSNLLIMLVFVAIGYVIHPIILPYVDVSFLSDQNEQSPIPSEKSEDEPSTKAKNIQEPVLKNIPPDEPKSIDSGPEANTQAVENQMAESNVSLANEASKQSTENSAQITEKPIDQQIIDVMQENLRSGKVSSLKYDAVKSWIFGGRETVDDDIYTIGVIKVDMVTILGLQERKIKALCQNGEVVKWVYASSGTTVD